MGVLAPLTKPRTKSTASKALGILQLHSTKYKPSKLQSYSLDPQCFTLVAYVGYKHIRIFRPVVTEFFHLRSPSMEEFVLDRQRKPAKRREKIPTICSFSGPECLSMKTSINGTLSFRNFAELKYVTFKSIVVFFKIVTDCEI